MPRIVLYTRSMRNPLLILIFACIASLSFGQSSDFAPVEQWQAAVLGGNAEELRSMYSISPPAQINTAQGKVDSAADVDFWTGLKPTSMNLSIVKSASLQNGIHGVLFQASLKTKAKMLYITAEQIWQQQGPVWRLIAEQRDVTKLEQP